MIKQFVIQLLMGRSVPYEHAEAVVSQVTNETALRMAHDIYLERCFENFKLAEANKLLETRLSDAHKELDITLIFKDTILSVLQYAIKKGDIELCVEVFGTSVWTDVIVAAMRTGNRQGILDFLEKEFVLNLDDAEDVTDGLYRVFHQGFDA